MTGNILQSSWVVELASSGAASGWVHLLPAGSFSGRDGRGPYTLRDAQRIITAAASRGMDLPIDYEHQIDHAEKNGQPAPAAGWIKQLKHDTRGIWGRVEWTAKAKAMLASREYRFLSPVFTYHANTGEIMTLLRAGLTNNPNLHLTALASQENPPADKPAPELRAQLLQVLALPEDTADQTLLDTIAALVAGGAAPVPDEARQSQLASGVMEMAVELNRVKAREAEGKAQAAVGAAITSGKLPPFLRDWGLALCRENPARFDEFAREMVPVLTPGSQINGHRQQQPVGELALMTSDGTRDEADILGRLGVSQDAYRKTLQREGS